MYVALFTMRLRTMYLNGNFVRYERVEPSFIEQAALVKVGSLTDYKMHPVWLKLRI